MGVTLKSMFKKTLLRNWHFFILYFLLVGSATYYFVFMTPKNSVELYQNILFAEDFKGVQDLILDGYEGNFEEEDFRTLQKLDPTLNRISQFALFEYENRMFVVMTSPGTEQLKVLAVEELPKEIRSYFFELDTLSQ